MNKNTPSQSDSETEWTPCTPGDLGEFVTVMKKRKQISHLITGAEILTGCLVVGLIGFLAVSQFGSAADGKNLQAQEASKKHYAGGLYCKEVLAHANDYISSTLSAELSHKMDLHLANCPRCQKKIDQLKANAHNVEVDQKAALRKQAAWEAYLLALNQ